ncbi:ABC transporter substrate-binding protein [Tepidibacter thalassicus]|uniref:Peptide/nickel transport system substrate-binding protein n=1 Tax=Tepidibacter thalassicus DSM 15285 TaxID=1123350 RepID=A0A1M5SNN7_9FIRM|nr:ABC transporter substrate-binding protein [Tepidibacter thalassicus]SHH39898.1 peptide/nickel transport system substrate-binding protein [Tepidibacter thalassicus DSM 15285]
MKKRFLVLVLSIAMIVALTTGCSSTNNKAEEKEGTKEKTLIYGSAADYTRINPALDEHAEIHKLIFTGLTKHNEKNEVVPDLAESWNFDESTNTYTFKLKKGVKWHDGKEFTADDVKFTIEAIKDPKNNSEIATNYEEIKDVEVVDKYTVKLHLDKPCVPILDYLSVGMLPKHLLEGKDLNNDSFNQNPIGTGPYKLDKWEMGQYIQLKANEDYYNGKPKIDKVVFKIILDEKTRAMQLKSGEIDLAQLEPKDISVFDDVEGIKLYKEKTADYRGVMYNFRKDLFKDKAVIKALSYAVNRQEIVDSVLNGMGKVAYSPLQMGPYNNENVEKYKFNIEKAKQILTEDGWKLGTDGILEKNGKKLSFKLTCFEGDPVRINMANVVSQQFKQIGVDAKVDIQSEIDWDNLDAFLIGWGSPFDPDDHTYKVFHSSQIETGMNLNAYSNSKVDELLYKARTTLKDEERKVYYMEFQKELALDPPFTFLAYIDAVYGAKENIVGIKDTVLGHHGVGFLWNIEEWDIQ